MAKIILATGSVFGAALLTGDEIESALQAASHEVIRMETQSIEPLLDESLDVLVVCTSTTGNGDVPDDLINLYNGLRNEYPRITPVSYTHLTLPTTPYV